MNININKFVFLYFYIEKIYIYMDYKFWILLLLCIVLFYMYHQIEDLKSEVQHLHTKTTNIAELENYIEKVKATEITKNLNNAINDILPKNDTNAIKLKSKNKEKSRSRSRSSHESSRRLSENISSSIFTSETSILNDNIVEDYSNKSETSLSNESKKKEEFKIELDDVMNIIEQNHMNDLNDSLNNKFKISEISEIIENKPDSDLFLDSDQESPEINENEILENNIQLNNEDNEFNVEKKIELNEENEENEEQIMQDINTQRVLIEKESFSINEDKNTKYNELMNKNVEELRTLASEQNITITKSVGGKQKKKRKKELCEELAYMK